MKFFFSIFQNGGFFPIADFFFEKSVFSAKSGEFMLRFEKFLFYLKALQKVMQVMVKKIFCSSKGSGDLYQKRSLNKQLD